MRQSDYQTMRHADNQTGSTVDGAVSPSHCLPISLSLLLLALTAVAAEPSSALKELTVAAGASVVLGEQIVDSPFAKGPDAAWKVETGEATAGEPMVLIKHTPASDANFRPKHASYILTRPFGDVLVRFSFQLRDTSRIGFIVDDTEGKHSGYFAITPKRINLPEKEPPKQPKPTYQEAAVALEPNRTYTVWLTLIGSRMTAMIDGGKVITGTRESLALGKSRLKLEVYDGTAAFSGFAMWKLEPVK